MKMSHHHSISPISPNYFFVLFISYMFWFQIGFSQEVIVSDHKGTKMTVTNNVVTTNNTAPSNPSIADVWFDNTDTTNVITKIYDGSSWVTVAASGDDDLGNHAATENLKLSGNWLSNDGESEGIYVENDGDVGIGTSSPSEELEVEGTVDAKAFKARVYTVEQTTSFTTANSDIWLQYGTLSQSITLTEEATVMINYSISFFLDDDRLATRLVIGSDIKTKANSGNIDSWAQSFRNITDHWVETLQAGTHTIRVQYRTNAAMTMNPAFGDHQAFLQVTVLGNQ